MTHGRIPMDAAGGVDRRRRDKGLDSPTCSTWGLSTDAHEGFPARPFRAAAASGSTVHGQQWGGCARRGQSVPGSPAP